MFPRDFRSLAPYATLLSVKQLLRHLLLIGCVWGGAYLGSSTDSMVEIFGLGTEYLVGGVVVSIFCLIVYVSLVFKIPRITSFVNTQSSNLGIAKRSVRLRLNNTTASITLLFWFAIICFFSTQFAVLIIFYFGFMNYLVRANIVGKKYQAILYSTTLNIVLMMLFIMCLHFTENLGSLDSTHYALLIVLVARQIAAQISIVLRMSSWLLVKPDK